MALNLDVPTATIDSSVWGNTTRMIGVGSGLALAALVALLLLTGRTIAAPIEVLSQAAQSIAAGDLNISLPCGRRTQWVRWRWPSIA